MDLWLFTTVATVAQEEYLPSPFGRSFPETVEQATLVEDSRSQSEDPGVGGTIPLPQTE